MSLDRPTFATTSTLIGRWFRRERAQPWRHKQQRRMTLDELKIQLEARQDFVFLQAELRKYLEENSFSSTPEQRERVRLVRLQAGCSSPLSPPSSWRTSLP